MTAPRARRGAARAPLAAAVVAALAGALTACTTTFTRARPAEYTAGFVTEADFYAAAAGASGTPSLFSTDSAVLDDGDIERILAHRYQAPPLSRIALLPMGFSAWSGWSEELALATADMESNVLATLMRSPHVYDAALLPSLLVPDKRTVPYLREAAARYQADLLLLFRSSCRTFERYRLFEQDETRAFCAVESVLLDVRTGLVPFVATATRNYDLDRSTEDLTVRETLLKAQLGAVAAALGDISDAVTRFLENVAAPSAPRADIPLASPAAVPPPAASAAPLPLTRATFEYAQELRGNDERTRRRSSF